MCRIGLLVVSIVLEMVLTGCLPVTTSSPIGTTVATNPDSKLTGLWSGNFGTSPNGAYIAFYAPRDGVRKIVLLAPPMPDGEGGWLAFEAHPATLGGNTYLDAREMDDGGKPPDPRLAHIPILYTISHDGILALYLVDENAARTAIARGAIGGNVEPGKFGDVIITADPATLDRFFASDNGRALFTKPLAILRRVN